MILRLYDQVIAWVNCKRSHNEKYVSRLPKGREDHLGI